MKQRSGSIRAVANDGSSRQAAKPVRTGGTQLHNYVLDENLVGLRLEYDALELPCISKFADV